MTLARVCSGRVVCSCNAIASSHHTNNSTKVSANLDSKDQACIQMKMPLRSMPGRATNSEKRVIRRSYNRRTRLRGGFRNVGFGFPSGLKPIFFHPPIKSSATEPQHLGGLAYITLRTLHRFADQNGLHGLKAEIFQVLTMLTQRVQSQVGAFNLSSTAHQNRTLEGVFEFADISWPRVLHQQLQRGSLESLDGPPV